MKRLILSAIGIAILAVGITTVLPGKRQPQPAQAQQASDKYDGDCTGTETAGRCAGKSFSHEKCQYPDRTTNPVDGCDNSDPCDPAQTKGGSGNCLPQSNTVEPETLPSTPEATSNSLNQYGGK